jgi:hypothetical protein
VLDGRSHVGISSVAGVPSRTLGRRPSLTGGSGASCVPHPQISPHFFLGKRQGLGFVPIGAAIEKVPAQQRKFLDMDSIHSNQGEIGPDATLGPHPVRPDAVKGEYPESLIVSEPGQNETHDLRSVLNLLRVGASRVVMAGGPPVTGRLILQNQAILARRPVRSLANFKDESSRVMLHQRRTGILEVSQQRPLDVVGLPHVDPLPRIRDSVDPRRNRSVRLYPCCGKRMRNTLVKRHLAPF